MESREFRLGNLVQDKEGRICKVTNLQNEFSDEKQIMAWPAAGGGLVSLPFSPIKITEDILLKFGAKHFAGTVYQLGAYKIVLFEDGAVLILGSMLSARIGIGEFVHQLQNLYYALSGEELEAVK